MTGIARIGQSRCELRISTALAIGNGRPVSWVAGADYWPDERPEDVLAALDAALAQIRAQLEIDIRESLR